MGPPVALGAPTIDVFSVGKKAASLPHVMGSATKAWASTKSESYHQYQGFGNNEIRGRFRRGRRGGGGEPSRDNVQKERFTGRPRSTGAGTAHRKRARHSGRARTHGTIAEFGRKRYSEVRAARTNIPRVRERQGYREEACFKVDKSRTVLPAVGVPLKHSSFSRD